MTKENLTN